ncbi:MAG: DNA gyrase inhibitor YacG [Proteobacteria bacterium]|nr:DNA gyrase inhibitor YacG [Pseudomonadota bacterium]
MTEPKIRPARLTSCPTCKKSVVYDVANPFRPFCSERCKNEDIIAWADEGFRIAGKAPDPDEEGDGESPLHPSASLDHED